MFQFTNRAVCVVALSIGCFAGSVFAAKGGISDQTSIIATVSKTNKVTKKVNTIGRTADSSDPVDTSAGGVVTTPTRTCDFSGFTQNDSVNRAYAGGTSNGGTAKMNNQMSFTGAVVINTYNGSGEPNSGIAYSPAGKIVIGLENFSASQISFSYSSSTALTVNVFSSNDGSGSAISTTTFDKTLTTSGIGGPFVRWTAKNIALTANAHSISFVGIFDRWGIDQVVVQVGVDCNNNGVPDATDIANGTSQDCNGNGIPDLCDIASGFAKDCNGNGVPDSCDLLAHGSPAPGAVQWRVEDGGNGHWYWSDRVSRTWSSAENAAELQNAHLATSTSSAENEFLRTVIAQFNLDRPWIGGFQDTSAPDFTEPAGGWRWVTGETWNYTRWASIEPNNQGGAENWLHFGDNSGLWNDLPASSQWTSIMEWETTQALDCNSNGIPDPCDIATGNSRDMNGNGKPDECEPNPVLTLTTNAAACNRVGSAIHVDATLSGVISPIVAGQVYLTWNSSKMTLDSITAGDAPFIEFHVINQTAGTALILVSLEQGGSAVSVLSKIVARMHFTVASASCDGSGTDIQFFPDGTLPTEFTDGVGGKMVPALVASSGFKVDDGAPVLSNVPANVTVQAEAGMGSFANVTLTPPTATDACAPDLAASSSRSDGASLSAAFPVGTTTVTWSATDPCSNVTRATTSVKVNNSNTATFAVSYTNSASYAASSARTLTLNIHGANGYTLKASQPVTLVNGAGTISLTDLAVDNYDCVAIEEKGRSLRRVATMTDGGLIWNSTATLVAGDLINDEVIDVLDWGAYIVGNPNADLDGNSVINATDGNIIIANFGQKGETGCGTSFTSPPEPLNGISVSELVSRGLTDLVGADLNNDGWLDMEDVRMASNGGRMNKDGWWDVAVTRNAE